MSGTFPEHIVPQVCDILEVSPRSRTITRSGIDYIVWNGVHRFGFELEWPWLEKKVARELMAFMAEQDGLQESFEFVPPDQEPIGTGAGAPVFDGQHSVGDNTIDIRGWLKGSKVLRKGDLLRIKKKVYRCRRNERADGTGRTTVQIHPPLYEDASDGEGITARGLSFKVIVDQDSIRQMMMNSALGPLYKISMTFLEDYS